MDIGPALRDARQQRGLTQAELARRAGTSQPAVARYETGVTVPSLATLARLLAALGLRLDVAWAPAPDEHDVALARQLRAMPARERLTSLARFAQLRERAEVVS